MENELVRKDIDKVDRGLRNVQFLLNKLRGSSLQPKTQWLEDVNKVNGGKGIPSQTIRNVLQDAQKTCEGLSKSLLDSFGFEKLKETFQREQAKLLVDFDPVSLDEVREIFGRIDQECRRVNDLIEQTLKRLASP